ncbi:MAG: sigma-70 family RNA polymerase sigma factor [Deltaproteobacteria bacterium]|nr:sigma-70 family RNA polymerase sigma factor [Deltaproteobacteria bacterium]
MGDAQLLAAWRDGDLTAGGALFERYYAAVVRFFGNKVSGDPADLIQETFEACTRSRDHVRDDNGFRSFLFGVAYNVLRRHYERTRRRDERVDPTTASVAELSPGPATMVASRDEHRLLLTALRRIPLEFQVILELFYWESMTSAAIAESLDMPHGTVRSRLRRARQLVEEALRELGDDPGLTARTLENLEGWAAQIRQAQGGLSNS